MAHHLRHPCFACRAMVLLEYDFATALDFGGIATAEAASAIKCARGCRGGVEGQGWTLRYAAMCVVYAMSPCGLCRVI